VTKWLSLVRLLLGEVPEHAEFTAPGLAKPLEPYFKVAQAVRAGDLVAFRCLLRTFLLMRHCLQQADVCLC
jgi:26S proteasome regulatory subunit N3